MEMYRVVAFFEAVDENENSSIKAIEGYVEATSAPKALLDFSAENDLEPIVHATVTIVFGDFIEQSHIPATEYHK